jgi:predicted HTH transcriptional regulator
MTESNRIEYKRELTDSLEKEVVAFLNYHDGGVIYLGIDKTGEVTGVSDTDAVQLAVKDRLEITSAGSVHAGQEQEAFFAGYSMPRNKTLMRVFKDLDMVEYLGSGIPHISKREMADSIGISTTAIDKNIVALKDKGLLQRIGSDKAGYWAILEGKHE